MSVPTFLGVGARTTLTAAGTVAHQTSVTRNAGDGSILFVQNKLSTTTISVSSGWALIDSVVVGTGSNGAGTGPFRLSAYFHEEITGSDADPTVTPSATAAADGWQAWVVSWSKNSTEVWSAFTCNSGSDTSSGTGFSAATSPSASVLTDDLIIGFGGVSLNTTSTSRGLASSPSALGALTNIAGAGSTQGNDMTGLMVSKPMTADQASVTFTVTATLGAASTGGALAVALRAAPSPNQTVSPTGIASAEAFGTHTQTNVVVVQSPGISSAEAFGNPVETNNLPVAPVGIASQEAFGTHTQYNVVTLQSPGIPSAEAFGVPSVGGLLVASPTGIGSAEAFGVPSVAILPPSQVLSPAGIASAEALGVPAISAVVTVSPTGIASAETFGVPVISTLITVSPTGIASLEALGVPTIAAIIVLAPTGIPSAFGAGNPVLAPVVTVSPTGIASAQAFGVPVVAIVQALLPTGIPSAEAFGVPVRTSTVTVSPTGIASVEAFGVPVRTGLITLSPTGIASAQAFGVPVRTGQITISPTGIASFEAFGAPILAGAIVSSLFEGWGIPLG